MGESEDKKLLDLVAALALLDTDFREHPAGAAKPSDDTASAWSGLHGRRWDSGVLEEMWGEKRIQQSQISEVYDLALELLAEVLPVGSKAGETPLSVLQDKLLDTEMILNDSKGGEPEATLFSGFLSTVLEAVTQRTAGRDYKKQAAGAIYLYNSFFHELVMVASHGFPLVLAKERKDANAIHKLVASVDEFLRDLGNDDQAQGKVPEERRGESPEDKAAREKKEEEEEEEAEKRAKIALALNVRRLRHCQMLQDKLMERRTGREDWTKQSWKASFGGDGSDGPAVTAIDCNDVLPGVAYYSPGMGITGQIFDKKAGPELERVLLTQMRGRIEGEWGNVVGSSSLAGGDSSPVFSRSRSFFIEDILLKRTVGYKHRDEMASGRQVVAGTYEPLQFPHSEFIGPFLGCVLRFGGEHFGVIKVELHRFLKTPKPGSDRFPESHTRGLKEGPDFFAPEAVVRFLLVAYALAGILYLLKHHHGVDLIDAFRLSWQEWKAEEARRRGTQ